MGSLKLSFYAIAVVAIIVGLIEIFADSGKLRGYVKYVISLIVIISLLYPIREILQVFPKSIEKLSGEIENGDSSEINESVKQAVEAGISDEIEKRFSMPADCYYVSIEIVDEGGDVFINKINIGILKKDYFRYAERIDTYLKSTYGCEINVIQEFEE